MRVLLVEDDRSLSMAVAYRLRKEGLEVEPVFDGAAAMEQIEAGHFDLVLLDRMLPGRSGVEVLQRLRALKRATPVLMLTAMDGVHDRVEGLDAGADDYLVKPFAMDELLARMRALLRRQPHWSPMDALSVGDVAFDAERLRLSCHDRQLTLSKREGKLIELLLRNQGQTLPRNVILDRVWSDNIVEDGNLDIYIHFLRKHLAALRSQARIETVRGVGYRLVGRV